MPPRVARGLTSAILIDMETETKKLLEQESKRSSQKIRAARVKMPSLSDDDPDEIVTVRAPIATLLGNG